MYVGNGLAKFPKDPRIARKKILLLTAIIALSALISFQIHRIFKARRHTDQQPVLTLSKIYKLDPELRKQHQELVARALINPVKVFQIGFSKCGTITLADFFNANGIASIHHDFGKLPASMYRNFQAGKPLLNPEYQEYYLFTDMERMYGNPPFNIGMLMFKELDRQYPGSKFILNIRDKQAWLRSRASHPLSAQDTRTILEVNMQNLKLSKEEVLKLWSKEWDEHIVNVQAYFKDRPQDLIVFNIESDPPEKLAEFFKHNFYLDTSKYAHKNKTIDRNAHIRKMTVSNKKH